jgi:two-component system response regulator HydG
MSSVTARREYAAHNPSRVVRILLVEDCKSDVFLFERLLENVSVNCFYEITDVPRLVDAFYKIDQEKFNLVMLDLNLTDIDGVAAVAALRAQVPELPIIVYSGTEDAKTKEKALMCGATHYLVKGRESGFSLKYMIERVVNA